MISSKIYSKQRVVVNHTDVVAIRIQERHRRDMFLVHEKYHYNTLQQFQ